MKTRNECSLHDWGKPENRGTNLYLLTCERCSKLMWVKEEPEIEESNKQTLSGVAVSLTLTYPSGSNTQYSSPVIDDFLKITTDRLLNNAIKQMEYENKLLDKSEEKCEHEFKTIKCDEGYDGEKEYCTCESKCIKCGTEFIYADPKIYKSKQKIEKLNIEPLVTGLFTTEDIVLKINEIIDYINSKE